MIKQESQSNLFLLVGLGNPGLAYRHTRHNFGYMAVDALAASLNVQIKRLKFKALIAETKLEDQRLVLAKPLTYMNESGNSVVQLLNFFKISRQNLLVISDDLDLPLGNLRIRPFGGPGGQKGVASIIQRLGSNDFPRMRLGIGRPSGQMDPSDYVLQKFQPAEIELKEMVLAQAVEAACTFITQGLNAAMNKYNGEVS